jgi:serine/threonine protein kinase
MDLLPAGDLYECLVQVKRFDEGVAAELLARLLSAVAYLHQKSIIHRDIKPDNILFQSPQDPKTVVLADFGLSANFADNPE